MKRTSFNRGMSKMMKNGSTKQQAYNRMSSLARDNSGSSKKPVHTWKEAGSTMMHKNGGIYNITKKQYEQAPTRKSFSASKKSVPKSRVIGRDSEGLPVYEHIYSKTKKSVGSKSWSKKGSLKKEVWRVYDNVEQTSHAFSSEAKAKSWADKNLTSKYDDYHIDID